MDHVYPHRQGDGWLRQKEVGEEEDEEEKEKEKDEEKEKEEDEEDEEGEGDAYFDEFGEEWEDYGATQLDNGGEVEATAAVVAASLGQGDEAKLHAAAPSEAGGQAGTNVDAGESEGRGGAGKGKADSGGGSRGGGAADGPGGGIGGVGARGEDAGAGGSEEAEEGRRRGKGEGKGKGKRKGKGKGRGEMGKGGEEEEAEEEEGERRWGSVKLPHAAARTASFGCRARRLNRKELDKHPPLSMAWKFMKAKRGFKFAGKKTFQVVSADGQIEMDQGEVRRHPDYC